MSEKVIEAQRKGEINSRQEKLIKVLIENQVNIPGVGFLYLMGGEAWDGRVRTP